MVDLNHVAALNAMHPNDVLTVKTVIEEVDGCDVRVSYAIVVKGCERYFVHRVDDNEIRLISSAHGCDRMEAETIYCNV